MKEIIAFIFGAGLVINGLLFVAQAVKIVRAKSSKGVSILTFAGFCVLQCTGILHGIFQQDLSLILGMSASLLACGSATILAIIYREKRDQESSEDLKRDQDELNWTQV